MEIGKKVVCIDSAIKGEALLSIAKMFKQWVVKGQKYTIREILENDGIVEGVLLEEIVNDPVYIDLLGREQEPAFGMFRFREIEEEEMEAEMEEAINELLEVENV